MPCKPCVETWTEYYLKKGFDLKTSRKKAKKLVKRVGKRMKREGFSRLERLKLKTLDIVFRTNWKATLLYRRRVGKGGNPWDYSQPCEGAECNTAGFCYGSQTPCYDASECRDCHPATCPPPLPHSHVEENLCYCLPYAVGCTCTSSRCGAGTQTPQCYASPLYFYCRYHCDDGYYWNGVACVAPAAGYSDGLVSILTRLYKEILGGPL